jgi:phosphoglycolate phosphatase-like HAD superfamily hydrolase
VPIHVSAGERFIALIVSFDTMAAPPYCLAIFDFDGTLADSFALFAEAYNELATRHGFKPVTTEEAQRLRSLHAAGSSSSNRGDRLD